MITDYTSLQAAVTEWLARDQDATLVARIPTFIQLAEAKFNRQLFVRQMEERSSATTEVDNDFLSLPSGFHSMRRIRITSVQGSPRLDYKNQQQIDEFRYMTANAVGQPRFFTVFGTEIEFAPTPDAAYTVEMIYRKTVPALADNSSNWLLTMAPDLYLYASLLEAAPYMKEDDRIAVWGSGFQAAMADLNNLNLTSTFNAGPLRVTVAGATP